MSAMSDSPAARAFQATKRGNWDEAAAIVAQLVREAFSLNVESVEVSRDGYSLNSVNGFVRIAKSAQYFFKFHHEEGEDRTLEELYRGELLRDAGYPVDVPVFVSREVGQQVLLYARRYDPRFVDICAGLDFADLEDAAGAITAQAELDELTCRIYLRTLHSARPDDVAREPIHQLFYHRLASPDDPKAIGGRARRFFWDRTFDLAGTIICGEALRSARWRINGIEYRDSIGELLERSASLLQPGSLARFGAVTAHGDAHNANIWWVEETTEAPRLVFFDPAFAGTQVSALLAEVKATFHNIFAHPLWLYSPEQATRRYTARAQVQGSIVDVATDWQISPLRERFLREKATRLWRPLLRELAARDLLAPDWRSTLRCALFCCPALVMDLRAGAAGGHTPVSSAIGLSVAVASGSEPTPGSCDRISEFLDTIAP
jgi:hypothetical protein